MSELSNNVFTTMIDQRYKNSLRSIVIILVLSGIVHFVVSQGGDFAGSMSLFLTVITGISMGIILLIFRLLGSVKIRPSFFYNYFGILNLALGFFILSAALYGDDPVASQTIITIIINFILGLFIIFDIYRIRPPKPINSDKT